MKNWLLVILLAQNLCGYPCLRQHDDEMANDPIKTYYPQVQNWLENGPGNFGDPPDGNSAENQNEELIYNPETNGYLLVQPLGNGDGYVVQDVGE